MPTKATIIERMGEQSLLLPALVARGLAANERLEYYLTLLQAAHAYAVAPRGPAPSLRMAREASGLTDSALDRIVEGSSTIGGNTLHIPHAESIVEHLFEELRLMLPPLEVAARAHPDLHARLDIYRRRLDDLVAHAPMCHEDQLIVGDLALLTRVSGNGHDTAHQLALDLHGELTRLETTVLAETIDGARAYGVTAADRSLVRAFMKGVNETASLKFDHPGLDTIATADGSRLSIQSDLGSTAAHVIVITVIGLSAVVRYTDVHRKRIGFLHDMLRELPIEWSAAPAGEDYDMSIGRWSAATYDDLERYLTHLGSRLVFLIDWNRARKRLGRLVRKSAATDLLRWAADNNVGHRAFLQVGDTGVIDAALERAAPVHLRVGGLDEWLGPEAAHGFLTSVLRVTSSGLTAGRSASLIEDEIEVELLRHVRSTDPHALQAVAEHATIVAALAERVRQTIVHASSSETFHQSTLTAELAKRWSTHADQLVVQASRRVTRASEREARQLLVEADGAADALEEAAFMLTLLPDAVDPETLALLVGLADLVADTVGQYVRCLEQGRDLSSTSDYSDVDDFLVGVDRLIDLHRQASAKKRTLTERLLRGPGDFHDLHVVGDVARGFERTSIALARCGAMVRDHVLRSQPNR
jgi:hypothetical protein